MEKHVHVCTGPDLTCPCGFSFRVPPICVSIEVFDRQRALVDDAFNCETVDGAIVGLERALRKLRACLNPSNAKRAVTTAASEAK